MADASSRLSKRSHQRLQFGLRTLLILVTLSALTFGFSRPIIQRWLRTPNLENRSAADEKAKAADAALRKKLIENQELREEIIDVGRDMKYADVPTMRQMVIRRLLAAMPDETEHVKEIGKKQFEAETWNFDRPDGRIVSVNAKKNTVWINIGRSDALRLHIKFSVYKRDGNVYKRQRKGEIEVTRFLGATMAEARITCSENADPILDGDVIFTPTWTPPEPERFVLVGDFGVNGDKKPYDEIFHELIRMSGGVIEDELTIKTRYLLLGTRPKDAAAAAKFETLRKKAVKLGIRIMTLGDLGVTEPAPDPGDLKHVLRDRERFGKRRFKQRTPPDGARRLEAGAKPKECSKEGTSQPSKRRGSPY